MRIVSVMTGAAPGGAEFAAIEMLDALIGRGHEAVMLSDDPGIGRGTRVEVRHLDLGPKLSGKTWLGTIPRWPSLRKQLRTALEAERPYDVLLLHYKKEQLLASDLPAALRAHLVWSEWGPVPVQMRSGPTNWAYRRAGKKVDRVVAISEGTRQSVIDAGIAAAKVAYLPNAVRADEIQFSEAGRDRVRRELGIPADAFTVGCISRFHPKKRNDVVIDAVAELGGDAHLILAGAGETEAQLRRQAEKLDGRGHVIATPGKEVGDVISAFDVSVFCPSPAEGQPRAVIIAMFASRPCLSTGAEGVADMIEDDFGAIAFPENEPHAVAELLRRYLGDPERVRREGAIARERGVGRYSVEAVGQLAEELITP
jgi:glycosyltransferase involved in cell wall biosynthesis